jgi:hypothetical protein
MSRRRPCCAIHAALLFKSTIYGKKKKKGEHICRILQTHCIFLLRNKMRISICGWAYVEVAAVAIGMAKV